MLPGAEATTFAPRACEFLLAFLKKTDQAARWSVFGCLSKGFLDLPKDCARIISRPRHIPGDAAILVEVPFVFPGAAAAHQHVAGHKEMIFGA